MIFTYKQFYNTNWMEYKIVSSITSFDNKNEIKTFHETLNQILYCIIASKDLYDIQFTNIDDSYQQINDLCIEIHYNGIDQENKLEDDTIVKFGIIKRYSSDINVTELKHNIFKNNEFIQFLIKQCEKYNTTTINKQIINEIHMKYINMPISFEIRTSQENKKIANGSFETENILLHFNNKINKILCESFKNFFSSHKIYLSYSKPPKSFPKKIIIELLKYDDINLDILDHILFKNNKIIDIISKKMKLIKNITYQNSKVKYLEQLNKEPKWYYTPCYMKNAIDRKIKEDVLIYYENNKIENFTV